MLLVVVGRCWLLFVIVCLLSFVVGCVWCCRCSVLFVVVMMRLLLLCDVIYCCCVVSLIGAVCCWLFVVCLVFAVDCCGKLIVRLLFDLFGVV